MKKMQGELKGAMDQVDIYKYEISRIKASLQ